MRERMSIACNEEKYQKIKNKEKEGKEKAKDTKSEQKVAFASSFAQIADGKKVYWVCGRDHIANKCPHCDRIPRDKWYKNTMEVHHINIKNAINHFMSNEGTSGNGINVNDNENGTVNNEDTRTSGQRMLISWEGFQSHIIIATCHQQEHVICEQKSIILDNGLTMSIFHD